MPRGLILVHPSSENIYTGSKYKRIIHLIIFEVSCNTVFQSSTIIYSVNQYQTTFIETFTTGCRVRNCCCRNFFLSCWTKYLPIKTWKSSLLSITGKANSEISEYPDCGWQEEKGFLCPVYAWFLDIITKREAEILKTE